MKENFLRNIAIEYSELVSGLVLGAGASFVEANRLVLDDNDEILDISYAVVSSAMAAAKDVETGEECLFLNFLDRNGKAYNSLDFGSYINSELETVLSVGEEDDILRKFNNHILASAAAALRTLNYRYIDIKKLHDFLHSKIQVKGAEFRWQNKGFNLRLPAIEGIEIPIMLTFSKDKDGYLGVFAPAERTKDNKIVSVEVIRADVGKVVVLFSGSENLGKVYDGFMDRMIHLLVGFLDEFISKQED